MTAHRNALAAAALAVILTASACSHTGPRPAAPAPASTAATAAAAVPAGMDSYRYTATRMSITLPAASRPAPNRTGKRPLTVQARVVAVLAAQNTRLLASTSSSHTPQLQATWLSTPTAAELARTRAAITAIAPHAAITTSTQQLIGISWSAVSGITLARDAARRLQLDLTNALPGPYAITVKGKTITVTWVAPGLTSAGKNIITSVIAQHAALTPDRVTTAPLTH